MKNFEAISQDVMWLILSDEWWCDGQLIKCEQKASIRSNCRENKWIKRMSPLLLLHRIDLRFRYSPRYIHGCVVVFVLNASWMSFEQEARNQVAGKHMEGDLELRPTNEPHVYERRQTTHGYAKASKVKLSKKSVSLKKILWNDALWKKKRKDFLCSTSKWSEMWSMTSNTT